MLAATLPHVDAWNTWFDSYGNTPEGFAELNAQITAAARDAGRSPARSSGARASWWRSDDATGERWWGEDVEPVTGTTDQIAAALRELPRPARTRSSSSPTRSPRGRFERLARCSSWSGPAPRGSTSRQRLDGDRRR